MSTSLVENLVYFEFGAESLGAEEFSDTSDLDNNSLTDLYRTFSWKDSTGSWPGEELPLTLLELVVSPSTDAASLELGISTVQPADGYTIESSERSIPIEVPAVDQAPAMVTVPPRLGGTRTSGGERPAKERNRR